MTDENKRVKLYSYSKFWKIEKKIYSFQNINLPVPINPYDLLSFACSALVMKILGNIIPTISKMPFAIRYVVIPLLISNYIMKKKLDGKNPVKYFVGIARHFIMERTNYFEKFNGYPDKEEKLKLNWVCSKGSETE